MISSTVLRESAVLIPVFRDAAGEATLVLVRRGEYGVHGGQLAFPGGKRDPADASLLATALRETEEEIGLPAAAIEVLAELPPLQTRTTGFRIAPFLARIVPPPTWRFAQPEIAEVLEVPLRHLTDPANAAQELWDLPGWPTPELVPFWRLGRTSCGALATACCTRCCRACWQGSGSCDNSTIGSNWLRHSR